MIFRHYREVVDEESAKTWFSIMPPDSWQPQGLICPNKHRRRIIIRRKIVPPAGQNVFADVQLTRRGLRNANTTNITEGRLLTETEALRPHQPDGQRRRQKRACHIVSPRLG
jgi:hypothetical protein